MWIEILIIVLAVIADCCVVMIGLAFSWMAYDNNRWLGYGVFGLYFSILILFHLSILEALVSGGF